MPSNFWEKLKRPILTIAPMSGITDEAFRLMFLKYGRPDVFWTEFVSADGLLSRGKEKLLPILKFKAAEHPIVAQVFGSKPEMLEGAAAIVAKLVFDGIDINMGCPNKDIEKQGAGAALMKNPNLAMRIISAVKKGAPNLPVSVKTRIGYSKNEINEWIPALLKENLAVISVHLRTRKEMSRPPAHWELAKKIVKMRDRISPKTLIFGNGDVKTLSEARRLAKETGLDGVMIGRGIIGNPWFFSGRTPSPKDRLDAIVEHAKIFEKLQRGDFNSLKKHFHAYANGFEGAKDLRRQLMKVKNAAEAKKTIKNFLEQTT